MALLLLAAVMLGGLPLSVEQSLLPAGERSACRLEPIDVCGAGDASLGVLADTPVLVAASVAVIAPPIDSSARAEHRVAAHEGFAPAIYRPPRLSC